MVIPNRGWPIQIFVAEFLDDVIGEFGNVFVLEGGKIFIKLRDKDVLRDRCARNETGEIDMVDINLRAA